MTDLSSSPDYQSPPAKAELRVLTQNCCLLPAYLFQSRGDDNRDQRAELISRMIQRYDIVLLQEVFGTSWCSQWRNAFKNVPGMMTLFSLRSHNKLVDSGLVILSRYPITAGSFNQFRSKSISNSVIDRGFLYASVDVRGTTVHVINTHLNPSECHCGTLTPQEYRRRQLREIVSFKESASLEHEAWIIGGDFNDTKVVFDLPATMCISLAREQPPTSHSLVPFAIKGDDERHCCIDYISSNRTQRYSKLLQNLISDHYGVESGILL